MSKGISETHPKTEEEPSQEFLDSNQYTVKGVRQYERVFGPHFVSTGGLETTRKFVKLLDLKRGMRVLDVCCGIGGSAFFMAQQCGVNVHGIDLSKNMIKMARQSAARQIFPDDSSVTFEICDATSVAFPQNSFDLIYSRDAIMHIHDKLALFKKFQKWLKPGGRIFITDYVWGENPSAHSKEFLDYVKQRAYRLLTPREYGLTLQAAGLRNVVVKDLTVEFIQILKKELKLFRDPLVKDDFIKEFGNQEEYDHLIQGWEEKVVRCGRGEQRWGAFYAEKGTKSFNDISSKL